MFLSIIHILSRIISVFLIQIEYASHCLSLVLLLHGPTLPLPFSDLSALAAGMGKKDDPSLMQQWFKLVQEKNALVRYESELMIL